MLIRLSIFIIIFFSISISNAAPKPYNIELGKATLEDVKKEFAILKTLPFGKGTWYFLDHSYFNSVWCDLDGVVQGMDFNEIIYSFEDIIKSLTEDGEYKLLGHVPIKITRLKKYARLRAGDYDIIVLVDTDPRFKTIYYMNKDFREALIAKEYIPYFE